MRLRRSKLLLGCPVPVALVEYQMLSPLGHGRLSVGLPAEMDWNDPLGDDPEGMALRFP